MKRRKNQIWVLTIAAAALLFTAPLKAQVTIGSEQAPDTNALLDLKQNTDSTSSMGLLLPRVHLTGTANAAPMSKHVKGMFVYNTDSVADVTPGVYYNDGAKWMKSGDDKKEWFYMPSFNLDVPSTGTNLTFDLYGEYKKQFTQSGNTAFVSSNPAATEAVKVYDPDQLEYYVTAYPSSCLAIHSISATGVMNYDVTSTNVPEGSFINVIFVVK
jgi:hypothetical protein